MFLKIYNLILRSSLLVVFLAVAINFLPDQLFKDFPLDPKQRSPIDFDSVIPQQWETVLSKNNPEFIQLNNIVGPESLVFSPDGLLYTGLADGSIVELDPTKGYAKRQVLKYNNSPTCKQNDHRKPLICGRFLQLRFLNNTELYAIEAATGLYKIDIKSGSKTLVTSTKLFGKNLLYNSFAFDPVDPNLVYLSISSTRWPLDKIIWSFLELESSGLVLAVDLKSGKQVTLVRKLSLANGIDVDSKNDRILFTESISASVGYISLAEARKSLQSAKHGDNVDLQNKKLIQILPGNPDNIIVKGDFAYIALPFVKINGTELIDHLASVPKVRRAVGRIIYAAGLGLEYITVNVFSHPIIESLAHEFKTGHFTYQFIGRDRSAVIEYNLSTGSSRLLGSDTFGYISEAMPDPKSPNHLLLGSFRSPFIVRVKV